MFSAVLDTSVLWPSLQRDFLLSMAAVGLYRPLWSDAILEELELHEALKLQRRGVAGADAATRAEHLISQMRTHFDDAMVIGWEQFEGVFGLPDLNDEHVVAAAVVGGADVIVTENLSDFPDEKMPSGVEVQDARTFAANAVTAAPRLAARALFAIADRHRNPPESPVDLVDALGRVYGMVEVREVLLPILGGK